MAELTLSLNLGIDCCLHRTGQCLHVVIVVLSTHFCEELEYHCVLFFCLQWSLVSAVQWLLKAGLFVE